MSRSAEATAAFAHLGLKPGAGTSEVKAAYRQLAKKHHPDVAPGDAASAERFKRITAAYTQALLISARQERGEQSSSSGAGSTASSSRTRPRYNDTPRAARGPVDPSRYNVREWERAHYGMHGGEQQSQSAYVRNLAREMRSRQAAEQMQRARDSGARGGSKQHPCHRALSTCSLSCIMQTWHEHAQPHNFHARMLPP